MTDEDPERLAERLPSDANDDRLRSLPALIREGRKELPSEEQLAVLATKLGPFLGGGGGGGAGGGGGGGLTHPPNVAIVATTSGAGAAKVAAALVLAAATVGTVWQVARSSREDTSTHNAAATVSATPSSEAPSTDPASVNYEPPIVLPTAFPVPTVSHPRPSLAHPIPTTSSGKPTPEAENEAQLLRRAAEALRENPKLALALCDQDARKSPDGFLAQERENIAIQALLGLGRIEDARARADAFRTKFPDSPHLRRIDQALSEH
jgi:hypothetical protein